MTVPPRIPLQLLPYQSLQQQLSATDANTLQIPADLSLKQLEAQLPAIYYSLMGLWLKPPPPGQSDTLTTNTINTGKPLSVDKIISSIPREQIGWEQIAKSNGDIVAEIVTLIKYQQVFVLHLRLLPQQLAQQAQTDKPGAFKCFGDLLAEVVDNLVIYGGKFACKSLICELYNPNLQQLFTQCGFKPVEDKGAMNPIMASTRMGFKIG